MVRDVLGGLARPLDRARVHGLHRQHREPLADVLGLADARLREVDAGRAAREQRAGLRGDRVADEHQRRGRRRRGFSPLGVVGVAGVGASVTAPMVPVQRGRSRQRPRRLRPELRASADRLRA